MKKLLFLALITLSSCAILDTIDTDSYTQYIEAGKDQHYFVIKQVGETHNKKLGQYNYVFYDDNDKIKLFYYKRFNLKDTLVIVKKEVLDFYLKEK